MLCFSYTLKLYILYVSNFRISNDAFFRGPSSILLSHLCKLSGPVFLYSKRYGDEFISKNYS